MSRRHLAPEEEFSLFTQLQGIADPRVERTRAHPLINILVITICAVIAGADDWVSVVEFGEAKYAWFARFLDLRNGIPSHDTFGRVFSLLEPSELQRCFLAWVQSVAKVTDGEIVAIDGKKLNGSADAPKGHYAIHMVSAWACENRLVLGQVKVNDKSNELKAIPQLLELLDLRGCIVTVDAAGTFAEVAAAVHAKGADWVLPLKENQPTLRKAVEEYFALATQQPLPPTLATVPPHVARTVDVAHGRSERREHWLSADIGWLAAATGKTDWPGLRSIGMVHRRRKQGEGQVSVEVCYYLSSLPATSSADAERFARAVRSHWCIENALHWVLDVAFDEDNNRSRTGHTAHNIAIVHHIALNLLKQEKSAKIGVKNKRLKAGWSNAYLAKLLFS
jgi:predicted transposase YbfD/YdcC